jgi:hypothetical protein
MKAYVGVDPYFLDLGTRWRSVVSLTPRSLYSGKKSPGTHWIGGWVDPKADMDDMGKRKFCTLSGLELRPLSRPAVASRCTNYAIPAPIIKYMD